MCCGLCAAGNAHGHGVKVWEDGSKYTGEWRDNMYHGYGTKLDPDGAVVHQGEWRDDQPGDSSNMPARGSLRPRGQRGQPE